MGVHYLEEPPSIFPEAGLLILQRLNSLSEVVCMNSYSLLERTVVFLMSRLF